MFYNSLYLLILCVVYFCDGLKAIWSWAKTLRGSRVFSFWSCSCATTFEFLYLFAPSRGLWRFPHILSQAIEAVGVYLARRRVLGSNRDLLVFMVYCALCFAGIVLVPSREHRCRRFDFIVVVCFAFIFMLFLLHTRPSLTAYVNVRKKRSRAFPLLFCDWPSSVLVDDANVSRIQSHTLEESDQSLLLSFLEFGLIFHRFSRRRCFFGCARNQRRPPQPAGSL